MTSFNAILSLGLLLSTITTINAAIIRPPSEPTQAYQIRGIDVDTNQPLRGYNPRSCHCPGVDDARGMKKDFNSAGPWKKNLKNRKGLPIPKLFTPAPSVVLVERSAPTETRKTRSSTEEHHLARRQLPPSAGQDTPVSYHLEDHPRIPYQAFPQYQSGYDPETGMVHSQQDEDEKRLAEYQSLKAEFKEIPSDAGLYRTEKGAFWYIPDRRHQKAVEANVAALAAAASVPEEPEAEMETSETSETPNEGCFCEECHCYVKSDHEDNAQEMTNKESFDTLVVPYQRTHMDDAEDVLEQLSLFVGPLPNNDPYLRKGTAQDKDNDYPGDFVQAPAPARRKNPVCLEETCKENLQVVDHSEHPWWCCTGEPLDCGQHCYSSAVVRTPDHGHVRNYNHPGPSEHTAPMLERRSINDTVAPSEVTSMVIPAVIAPMVIDGTLEPPHLVTASPIPATLVIEKGTPSNTESIVPPVLKIEVPASLTESNPLATPTVSGSLNSPFSKLLLNPKAAYTVIPSFSTSTVHDKSALQTLAPTSASAWPSAVTGFFGPLKPHEKIAVFSQGYRDDGAYVRFLKKVTVSGSEATSTPAPSAIAQSTRIASPSVAVQELLVSYPHQPVASVVPQPQGYSKNTNWGCKGAAGCERCNIHRHQQLMRKDRIPESIPEVLPSLSEPKSVQNTVHSSSASAIPSPRSLVAKLAAAGVLDALGGNTAIHITDTNTDVDMDYEFKDNDLEGDESDDDDWVII